MSGEDGSLHVAWRSGKVFRKADSLINLARDAVKADDVDALGDESRQESAYSRGVGIILMLPSQRCH